MSSNSKEIEVPHGWEPRVYQFKLWDYLQNGGNRAVAVWHRRSGKDSLALNWTATAMLTMRPGVYWHMLPEAAQARKAIWDGRPKNAEGAPPKPKFIDQAFPKALRTRTVDQEMKIEFRNGSLWQVVGSDNYDSLVGANPIGVVFSEYALAKPEAWNYIRPILAENGGWALFVYTPRGENHGYDLFRMAQDRDDWFAQRLTWKDTDILTPEDIENERAELEAQGEDADSVIDQEYGCSFSAAVRGSYYGKWLDGLEKNNRITDVPHNPSHPVETWWDLGKHDDTSIWFVQQIDGVPRAIDYLENRNEGVEWYVKELRAKPYNYREHLWPHDGAHSDFITGKPRSQVAQALGLKPIRVVPRGDVMEGIQKARTLLPQMLIDKKNCRIGLRRLRHYSRQWNEAKHCFADTPRHDEHSHGADAFRTGAVGMQPITTYTADPLADIEPARGSGWSFAT